MRLFNSLNIVPLVISTKFSCFTKVVISSKSRLPRVFVKGGEADADGKGINGLLLGLNVVLDSAGVTVRFNSWEGVTGSADVPSIVPPNITVEISKILAILIIMS